MKQLEDKIIRSMYVMETKKMSLSFLVRFLFLLFFGGAALLMIQVLFDFMSTGQTFDVLAIFSDDMEIVRSYLGDIINVIFQETPRELLLAVIISLLVVIAITLTFIFNFGKIRHKFAAIVHYWQHTN